MSKPQNWAVTLTPHRSLSRQGFLTVMAIIAAANFVGGLAFFIMGAWPIVGFMGADVALMWWAFRRNFADARRAERITVEGDAVTLIRLDAAGSEHHVIFNRRWIRVELEFDEEREIVGRLLLRSHGVRHEIASFLGAEERQALARELKRAL